MILRAQGRCDRSLLQPSGLSDNFTLPARHSLTQPHCVTPRRRSKIRPVKMNELKDRNYTAV
jgi:hypothetical protein